MGAAAAKVADVKTDGLQKQPTVEDDEPDEWDKRIFSTGCSDENAKMTDCYFATRDWRACKKEMEIFRECWKRHGNEQRTDSKDS
ncbi:hypothetical protein FKW77_005813 [Venturia effusa]|uniref:CHCH domain-containing protein n=1 Tax=Venturia effusa TaxID=50376 RepID=A0A517LIV5_9PEZI|nr:hypothetical protein FKW77_005813 [Venturia effusa]